MEIEVLGADSLGVRSMCIRLAGECGSVVVDPGAALGPRRFGLPPAPQEENRLVETVEKIQKAVSRTDGVVVSHYHYDHHSPQKALFSVKKVFLKHVEENINRSQRERGGYLVSLLDEWDISFEFVDSMEKNVNVGDLSLSFSMPVPHGPQGTRLGFVIMTAVTQGGETVVHTSDIEGLLPEEGLEWIVEKKPDVIFADGPPTYLGGYRFSRKNVEAARKTMRRLLNETDARLVLDHHLLRDPVYRKAMAGVFHDDGGRCVRGSACTMAAFAGKKEDLLEARRRSLWENRKEEKNVGEGNDLRTGEGREL